MIGCDKCLAWIESGS